jgi:hypothetical protein
MRLTVNISQDDEKYILGQQHDVRNITINSSPETSPIRKTQQREKFPSERGDKEEKAKRKHHHDREKEERKYETKRRRNRSESPEDDQHVHRVRQLGKKKTWKVDIGIGTSETSAVVDTGSSGNLISEQTLRRLNVQ